MSQKAAPDRFEIARLSTRGQLVIPKSIRTQVDWQAGDYVAVEVCGDQVVMRKLRMEDVLKEADREWEEGETVRLWPKEE